MPGATTETGSPSAAPSQDASIDELLKGLELDFGNESGEDRYAPPGTTPPAESTPVETATETAPATPTSDASAPAAGKATSDVPATNTPTSESPTE
jgi:hypothetical protein